MTSNLPAVIAAIITSSRSLAQRGVLKNKAVSYAGYALFYHAFSAAILLPTLLFTSLQPSQQQGWLYAIAGGALWAALAIVGMRNIQEVEAPRLAIIKRFQIIAVAVLSVLFLSEALSAQRVASLALILAGVFVMFDGSLRAKISKQDALVLFAALLSAAAIVVDKTALRFFEPLPYAFLMYALPLPLIVFYARKNFRKHAESLRGSKKMFSSTRLQTFSPIC